jgi:putative serine protease PepD
VQDQQYVPQDHYAQQQQWPQQHQQDQWSYQQQPQQQYQYQQQPERQWAPAPEAPSRSRAETPARSRAGRGRVMVIGLVVALLLVSGWQAFRVEGMIQASTDLANAVSAEQGRSEELEKKLTTVFDPEGISSAVLPSVFRVRAGDFTGTAFAVGQTDDGETNLFTNYHVIEETFTNGDKRVSLERGNTRIDATIIKVNERRDLALLRAERDIKGLGLAAGEVKPGQQVVVVGAPLGLDDSVAAGVISAYRPDDAAGPTIQFDAPINPGNSGGPVVNASKQVVGIATAKARDAEGIGLAIPIQTACETLEVCGNN